MNTTVETSKIIVETSKTTETTEFKSIPELALTGYKPVPMWYSVKPI